MRLLLLAALSASALAWTPVIKWHASHRVGAHSAVGWKRGCVLPRFAAGTRAGTAEDGVSIQALVGLDEVLFSLVAILAISRDLIETRGWGSKKIPCCCTSWRVEFVTIRLVCFHAVHVIDTDTQRSLLYHSFFPSLRQHWCPRTPLSLPLPSKSAWTLSGFPNPFTPTSAVRCALTTHRFFT